MGSNVFVLIGLLIFVLLIVSEAIVAKDLAQTSTTSERIKDKEANTKVEDAKHTGYLGGGYGSRGGYPGGSFGGLGGLPSGGYGGRGGIYCPFGCCYGGFHSCLACCASPAEAAKVHAENKPHN